MRRVLAWGMVACVSCGGISAPGEGVGANAGSPDVPTASCRPQDSCSVPGAVCVAPASYGQTDLCVCDDATWKCPATDYGASCPAQEPAVGSACGNAYQCAYPPYPAPVTTADVCTCSDSEDDTQLAWSCGPWSVPGAPPANGSTCTDPSSVYAVWGAGFELYCECLNVGTYSCSLYQTPSSLSLVVSGTSCDGYPRGYPLWQMTAPNQYEACTCAGSTAPTWSCTAASCPATEPTTGGTCALPDPDIGNTCAYGALGCVCRSGQWLCDE